jgi:hypothetical protein
MTRRSAISRFERPAAFRAKTWTALGELGRPQVGAAAPAALASHLEHRGHRLGVEMPAGELRGGDDVPSE